MMGAMTATLGARPRSDDQAAPPPAVRVRRTRWRDPRVVVGVVLVALSVVLGATLIGRADDTVAVWAVRDPLRAGQPLSTTRLVRAEVHIAGAAAVGRYLAADAPVPSGVVAAHDVGAGELLPRAALTRRPPVRLTQVPLAVPTGSVPADLRAGQVVDVWVTPDAAATPVDGAAPALARRVLADVTVVSAATSSGALGPSATREVLVGVGGDRDAALARALAALARGTVVLTRQS